MNSPDSESSTQKAPLFRVMDANANRALEGMRVLEDHCRFVASDGYLTRLWKDLRHELVSCLSSISTNDRLAARDTVADVGTTMQGVGEYSRSDFTAILSSNCSRVQQSLRCLEEYGKLLDAALGTRIESLRYQSYEIQRAMASTMESRKRFGEVQLYLLIDARAPVDSWCQRVATLIEAGVDAIQLRGKRLDDNVLLDRAKRLRSITRGTPTLCVINDRPDIAALCSADGVHLGQPDLSARDARSIVGTKKIIGVSTHSLDEARRAVMDGANYIGVGPVFSSDTKHFNEFPGLNLLRQVQSEITLPSLAIGGIRADNLPSVLETGFARIAVSGAIWNASDPRAAVVEFKKMLHSQAVTTSTP